MIHALALDVLGRGEDALRATEETVRRDPLSKLANIELGFRLIGNRFDERAAEQLRRTTELDTLSWRANCAHGLALARRVWLAAIYAALGQSDTAIDTLENGLESRSPLVFNHVRSAVWFSALAGNPRFEELRGRDWRFEGSTPTEGALK